MATDEERQQEYREDAQESYCPYCTGKGYRTVENDGSGPRYACPDCSEVEDE